jgi:transketolase
MHTVKPLDSEALTACCRETRAIFTVEEHSLIGGLGSAIAEWMAANGLRFPLSCFGAGDCFAPCSGSQAYFRDRHGLTAAHIAQVIAARLG